MDDRSPVICANDLIKLAHPAFCSGGTSAPVTIASSGESHMKMKMRGEKGSSFEGAERNKRWRREMDIQAVRHSV